MLQLKVIFHAIILLISALMFVRSSNTTIQLQFSQNQGSNVITLWCRNLSDSLSEPGAVFYLNGSELNPGNYPFFSHRNNQPGEVIFLINRQLEGMYSCGVGQVKSSPRSLIVYPTSDTAIRRNNKYFAVVGDTAVLECAVLPGALIHYYYVTWQNGSRIIFRQSLPSQRNSTFPDSIDPRYRLDPMNLSLIIDNVRRSDSILDYNCVLQVVYPESGYTDEYRAASNVSISLTVLSPPIITMTPREDTVRQGENTIFNCKAQGYPLPKIIWMHNNRIITDHHPDYFVSPSVVEANTTVTSNLRIFSVTAAATGKVTCIASANSPGGSGITLANRTENTSLTVLGQFRKFDVLISTEGDVILSLELPTEYYQPIHLFLKYTNDDNPTESYNRTTEIGFLNTKSVQYMEYSSQVYYDRFRIEAGLVSGYREVLGPLYSAPGIYDTTRTTFCESGFNPLYTIIFGVFATLLIILCIVLVVVMCIVILKKDNDLLKYQSSHKEQMENELQKSNISTTTKSPEPHGESDSSPIESAGWIRF